MNRYLVLAALWLALVASCGDDADSMEAHQEAFLKLLRESAAVLRTVKDRASAEAARPRLEELVKRREELKQAWERFPPAVRNARMPDTPYWRQLASQIANAANDLMFAMDSVDRITRKDPEVRQILISAGVEKLVGREPD